MHIRTDLAVTAVMAGDVLLADPDYLLLVCPGYAVPIRTRSGPQRRGDVPLALNDLAGAGLPGGAWIVRGGTWVAVADVSTRIGRVSATLLGQVHVAMRRAADAVAWERKYNKSHAIRDGAAFMSLHEKRPAAPGAAR